MPRRDDINRILLLGSGPIRIGQAAEFDFSGSQACRALREDGFEIILVNSNPATIQNDPEMADVVYIEPLLPDVVRQIIEKEKPDAILAGMGGQTALNIASELAHDGTLEKYGVELIGNNLDSIDRAEDRALFKRVCESIGLPVPFAIAANSIDEVAVIGLPDDQWGEIVTAVIVIKSGFDINESDIIDYCKDKLSSYKRPEKIIFDNNLPRNSMGKILKKDLRKKYSNLF